MDKALDIAKFIVNKNEGMTNLELQKILYYLYVLFYRKYEKDLFDDDFRALKYGPVIIEVYEYFNVYGSSQLFSYAPENLELSREEIDFLISMSKQLSNYDVWDLVESTHRYSPWKGKYMNQIITKEEIKDYHKNDQPIKMYRGVKICIKIKKS